jgi:uncharacterized protein YhbP (UPF0306 family)
MDLKALLSDYFRGCKAMQLATVSDGQPWICTVYFVSDADFNIYWTSAKSRRHSKEIVADPQTAIAIVKDVEHKQGMQITGEASIVSNRDVEMVNKLYGDKFGDKPVRLAEVKANDPDGRAYWVFKPTVISLWDEVNFPNTPKQEYRVR